MTPINSKPVIRLIIGVARCIFCWITGLDSIKAIRLNQINESRNINIVIATFVSKLTDGEINVEKRVMKNTMAFGLSRLVDKPCIKPCMALRPRLDIDIVFNC